MNEIDKLQIDRSIIQHIKEGNTGKFEPRAGMDLISFDLLNIDEPEKDTERIVIMQTNERVQFIARNEYALDKIKSHTCECDKPDTVLYDFFSSLLKFDMDRMDDLEESITLMENALLSDTRNDYTIEIIGYRKKLLRLKKYYEQLSQIFDGFIANDNKLLPDDNVRVFGYLDKRADQLLLHVNNLRDYITQVREAWQAQIDIQQNEIMKVFTVIAAIFLPLTLIVGWYGMNLIMPEIHWQYGYPFVIALSVAVVVVMIVYFKKKKWF